MLPNWQSATIVHSVPQQSWGLAETSDKKIVFLRMARAVSFELRGEELVSHPALPEMTIPDKGTEVVFADLIPAERGGKYHQADPWTTREHMEKMEAAAAKAAATLARLAAENAEKERKRRETILHNSRPGKKKHDKKGKKERANA